MREKKGEPAELCWARNLFGKALEVIEIYEIH